MKHLINCKSLLIMGLLAGTLSCKSKQDWESPAGYNFNNPIKYKMPDELQEISGITFNSKGDSLFAEEDEHGRVYRLKPGDKKTTVTAFKDKGDFEDIAVAKNQVIMLESKGRFFVFPQAQVGMPQATNVQEFKDLVPEGEYEGMYADRETGDVYVLCKHCADDKPSKHISGFILQLSDAGQLQSKGSFEVDVKDIEHELNEKDKISFRPSGLTQNPRTKQWYILSSVNKLLVVTTPDWKVKHAYHLNPELFPQPEGITFDKDNNLWISNEGQTIGAGTALKFTYHKQ